MKNIHRLKVACIACFALLLFSAGKEKERNSNIEKPLIKSEVSPSADLKGSAALLYNSFSILVDYGNTYYLRAEVPVSGFLEWYIIENATTYIKVGETNIVTSWPWLSELYFYFDKPVVPGTYRMWAEGPGGESFTREIVLGD